MGSHSITCHLAEVTFPPLHQPIKAGTRFSNHRGMQGWVDLVGLVTYRGGIPAQRRSPIPALTGLNVEQLRSCDERRYRSAKPPASGPLEGEWRLLGEGCRACGRGSLQWWSAKDTQTCKGAFVLLISPHFIWPHLKWPHFRMRTVIGRGHGGELLQGRFTVHDRPSLPWLRPIAVHSDRLEWGRTRMRDETRRYKMSDTWTLVETDSPGAGDG